MKTFIISYGNTSIDFSEVEEIPADTCGNYVYASSQEELEDVAQQWAISYNAEVYSVNYNLGCASICW